MASFSPEPAQVSLLLEDVKEATEKYSGNPDEASRIQMVKSLGKMMEFVSNPIQEVFRIGGMTHIIGAIRSAIEMDLFMKAPADGNPITAAELASKSGAERLLIVRILRALTSNGIFDEVGVETYKHNSRSIVYNTISIRDIVKHHTDVMLPCSLKMGQYLSQLSFQNPGDQVPTGFGYTHGTDEDFFTWVKKRPDKWKIFNSAMQATHMLNPGEDVSAFAFDEELRDVGENEVAVIDCGGGRGDFLKRVKEKWPGIKGRFMLQDLPGVVAGVGSDVKESGIECTAHDFFQPQPVKGAHVYHFRRVMHDWSDEKCREILRNIIEVMDPKHSRVVIAEMVLPDQGVPSNLAMMDMMMMSLGGMERNEGHWRAMLDSAGLKLVKIWRSKDGVSAALEARLP